MNKKIIKLIKTTNAIKYTILLCNVIYIFCNIMLLSFSMIYNINTFFDSFLIINILAILLNFLFIIFFVKINKKMQHELKELLVNK